MSDLLERAKEVNEKIKDLNIKREKAKAQKDLLRDSLMKNLEIYKKKYGVDLLGGSFEECEDLIKKEYESVNAEYERQVSFAERVVSLIEDGKIEEAQKVLGVAEEKVSEKKPEEKTRVPAAKKEESKEVRVAAEVRKKSVKAPVSEKDLVEDSDEGLDLGFGGDFGFEDEKYDEDEKEDEFLYSNSASSVARGTTDTKQKLNSVEKAVKDVEETKKSEKDVPKTPFGSFSFDDDDDSDDTYGFKSLLSGSKFEY